MLKTLDPLLTGDMLKILADMGHGDDLVIADANFPAASMCERVVYLPGLGTTDVLRATLSLFPLDEFVDRPAAVMDAPAETPPIFAEFEGIMQEAEGKALELEKVERFAFYERTKLAYAVFLTGERRLYGNILVKKGVVRPG